MGGSALAADMAKVLVRYDINVPLEVVKTYSLPGYVGENTLVIVEHPDSVDFSYHPNFSRLCNYGKVHFSFFRTEK